ncbi:glycosyltransferase family 2 protein [Glaesserella sp.]|uniref:glycosyltransferase family 2 protein n=1 Tax=Glaesserella sp. TaxID=2094731 RepID=UPI0035A12B20
MKNSKIAVLIPCYNEAITIAQVVSDFKRYLPDATIYVYDNNSLDNTYEIASSLEGVVVGRETEQGKGAVVRRMFRDINADYYIMVDGDSTYDASIAPKMLNLAIKNQLDLVNGVRIKTAQNAYRSGHEFGNKMLTGTVRQIFGDRVQDMLSGYKVFSKRFVKSFPIFEQGFGIETELTIHALELDMPVGHVEGNYGGRPEGSVSKLNTYKDGIKILSLIVRLFKHERPFTLFGAIAAILFLISMLFMLPVFTEYFETGLVPKLPSLLVGVSILLSSIISFFTGVVLNTVSKGRRESKLLFYLNIR